MNEKQGSAPREAAKAVVRFVNDRDPFVGVNALTLLDTLVKNCGYPFHLQILRKEFLNELVRRFPERPPLRYTKVQRMVLAQIQEWNETICKGRYAKDLGFIRDMHRLLSYKGYIFPEVDRLDLAVLGPSDAIQSPEELAKEERLAQSAKLQELIRRGRPEDLAEANQLMKIMSGFKEDKNLNEMTRQKLALDLTRIQNKVEVFAEMVNGYNENDSNAKGSAETLEELYSSLKAAQPTLHKIALDDQVEEEVAAQTLSLNDTLGLLLKKYELIRNKDVEGASKITVGANGAGNLIDFDDDADNTGSSSTSPPPPPEKDSLADLLGGLNLSGPISLSPSVTGPAPAPVSLGTSSFETLNHILNLDKMSTAPLNQGLVQLQISAAQTQSLIGGSSLAPDPEAKVLSTSQLVKILYVILPRTAQGELPVKFSFSNMSLKSISELTFLVAVSKGLRLELAPQLNTFLMAMATDGITQVAKIKGEGVPKIKWKLAYLVDGERREETGVNVLT